MMQTTTIEQDTEQDTTDLVRAAAAGVPGAWDELVRRYTPLLRSRTRGFRLQEADALDVAQATWLRLAENLHRIHTPEHLAGWLATVVSRECIRLLRHGSRTIPADEPLATAADPRPGPEDVVVDADTCAALRTALDALPARRRALVAALFLDDRRPYVEIARDLGMAVGSLGPTRARTLTELRRLLDGAGVVA
ncbi:sigma-70 family RNA polymerase sigma factor [Pseudonocardia oceani]|uniref:Sigma-70 family RNA polymerase sigma factor n=2 Tax=Pseudonocardia oceani TaxID=2792013 RepID=A0ABS6UDN2_9PSEU|nr:sigma-70 family RNA polymerase sigma factor [Pseudonocardia oceani]